MLTVALGNQQRSLSSVLCLGAHCDDIEIGCGGTIIRLAEEFPDAAFHWVVFSSDATNLVADDTNDVSDVFVRGPLG